MGAEDRSFWTDPQRALLGSAYMAGSVLAFAAGLLTGLAEVVAVAGWVVATIGFYWTVHATLRGTLRGASQEAG